MTRARDNSFNPFNNQYAGKNKVINGDFNINQRNFTSITFGYGFDRWVLNKGGNGTCTYTPQTFTLGTAPVAGYEGRNFARLVTTGETQTDCASLLTQYIESVRTLANQTVTVSFWAKAGSGTPSIAASLSQDFGTGGSPSALATTPLGKIAITTSWARYSFTATLPSIAGKTLGTNNNDALRCSVWVSAGSDFNTQTTSLGIQSGTFDIWGVQVEAGPVATSFVLAGGGSQQAELDLCQRYYHRISCQSVGYQRFSGPVGANASTLAYPIIPLPVTLRSLPTSIDFSLTGMVLGDGGSNTYPVTALTLDSASGANLVSLAATVASGLTQYRPYQLTANNSSSPYLGFSAEL